MACAKIDHLFDQLESYLKRDSASLLSGDHAIYIYGAGNVGRDVGKILQERGLRVAGFLDRKAGPGSTCAGCPLSLPMIPLISAPRRAESHVLIGIFNRETEIPPIVDYLRSLGYGRVTTFLDLHDALATELGDRFWLTGRTFYSDKKDLLSTAASLWSDETSRNLFLSVLECRLTGRYEAMPKPNFQDQYFPVDLPAWPGPIRFIDCGAFDGDTLRQLAVGSVEVEAFAAFEPDPANFLKLVESAKTLKTSIDTLALFHAALVPGFLKSASLPDKDRPAAPPARETP